MTLKTFNTVVDFIGDVLYWAFLFFVAALVGMAVYFTFFA